MRYPLHHKPFVQLLTVLLSMLGCFIILSFLAFFLALPLFDLSVAELVELFDSGGLTNHLALMKYFQSVQSLGLFVVPAFIIAWLYARNPSEFLAFQIKPKSASFVFVIVIIFFSLPFVNFLSELNQSIHFPDSWESIEQWLVTKEDSAQDLTRRFLRASTWQGLVVNLILVGVLPAVGEELIFRGILQRIFSRWTQNVHYGILISAFLFSAVHLQFYGLLPRFFLGMLFGYFLLWSGSIWLPILGHFINNAGAVIMYFFTTKAEVSGETYETMSFQPIFVIFSIGLIGLFGYLIYNTEHQLRDH